MRWPSAAGSFSSTTANAPARPALASADARRLIATAPLYFVAAQRVHRLRRQADMAHDRDTARTRKATVAAVVARPQA